MRIFLWIVPFLFVACEASRVAGVNEERIHSITNIVNRQLASVEEFCSDLSEVESFLLDAFQNEVEGTPTLTSDGYECECDSEDPLELELDCDLTYFITGDSEVIENKEDMTFVLVNGQYVPSTVEWCEEIDGSNEHCETYTYCDDGTGTLCSCEGDDCGSCEICPNGEDVAIDCSESRLDYVATCDDGYKGAFLSEYDFDISAPESATVSPSPVAPTAPSTPTSSPMEPTAPTPTDPGTSAPTAAPVIPSTPIPSAMEPTDSTPTDPGTSTPTAAPVVPTAPPAPSPSPMAEPTDSMPTDAVMTVQDFCSDLSDVESFLLDAFEDFVTSGTPTSDGYDCTCVSQEPLLMECTLSYTFENAPEEVLVNVEKAAFVLEDGLYVPATVEWCEMVEGSDSEHCETFTYCRDDTENLCSCTTNEGDACPSCEICPNGEDVAIDCSGVEGDYSYTFTCEQEYKGAFLSGYEFDMIASATTPAPTPVAPPPTPTDSSTSPTVSTTPMPTEGESTSGAAQSFSAILSVFAAVAVAFFVNH